MAFFIATGDSDSSRWNFEFTLCLHGCEYVRVVHWEGTKIHDPKLVESKNLNFIFLGSRVLGW